MARSDDVYRAINAAHERFAYFFLAGAGGAVAYALAQTEGRAPAPWMVLAGIAAVGWGASFNAGVNHLLHHRTILNLDFERQKIVEGIEGRLDEASEEEIQAAMRALDDRAQALNKLSRRDGKWQVLFFFFGAGVYTVGHIWRTLTVG